MREFALSVPEIVHLTVMTPYPGTDIWHTESRRLATRDYRLFDIQHAVAPTALPLEEFYRELVRTQSVINRKHLGLRTAAGALRILGGNLARGQTNFARMLWKFNKVYTPSGSSPTITAPSGMSCSWRSPAGERRQLYVHAHAKVPREKKGAAHLPRREPGRGALPVAGLTCSADTKSLLTRGGTQAARFLGCQRAPPSPRRRGPDHRRSAGEAKPALATSAG